MKSTNESALQIRDLTVEYRSSSGIVRAVDGVGLEIRRQERLGLVGESGSGKSTLAAAIMGLLRPPGQITTGAVVLNGKDLVKLSNRDLARVRGAEVSMIYQSPFTFLNPVIRVGEQVVEGIRAHRDITREEARDQAGEILSRLQLSPVEQVLGAYPHQLSGGQRQRIVIAMAVVLKPALIIADEPTTALDVTVQAQILGLLDQIVDETHTSLMFISHDLQVVRSICDRIAVMYAGQIVEVARTKDIFNSPQHPYTEALIASSSPLLARGTRFEAIPGDPVDPLALPTGCRFGPRCSYEFDRCRENPPLIGVGDQRHSRCWLSEY